MVGRGDAPDGRPTNLRDPGVVLEQVPGTVATWDRSEGKGWVKDEDGDRHRLAGSDVDSPVLSEGDDIRFDIVESGNGDGTRATRAIVQRAPDGDSTKSDNKIAEPVDVGIADDDRTDGKRLDVLANWTAFFAGITAILLSAGTFAILAGTLTSFPVTTTSLIAYGTSFTYPVWGCVFIAAALGSAVSTTYWYGIRIDPVIRNERLVKTFVGVFGATLLITATIGFLRLLVAFVVLLSFLLSYVGGPIIFLSGLVKRNGATIAWSLAILLLWFICGEIVGIDSLTDSQMYNLFGIVAITAGVLAIPRLIEEQELAEASESVARCEDATAELNSEIRSLNHERLAAHGLEIPHLRASLSAELQSENSVLVPPKDEEAIREWERYYGAVSMLGKRLSSISSMTSTPTDVTKKVCELVDGHSPDRERASLSDQSDLIGSCVGLLETYGILLEIDDESTIIELEDKLRQVVRGKDSMTAEELQTTITEIESWASERVRYAELQKRRDTIEERWTESAGDVFGLDISAIKGLEINDDHDIQSVEMEAVLDTADQVISLAKRVETLRETHPVDVVDRIPTVFGDILVGSETEPERTELLHEFVDVTKSALHYGSEYEPYPFDEPPQILLDKAEEGTLSREDVEAAENLLADAVAILSFLEQTDMDHPSVDPNDWRESVRIGLENLSTDIIRPPAKQIERMGDTLWQRSHLSEFTWEEFEHLVASVLQSRGFETKVTQSSSDGGVDVWARQGTTRTAVQVKQFSDGNRVGRPDVQKLASTIAKGDADRAMVVTSSAFASTAKSYAADFGGKMRLVDGDELVQLLTDSDILPPVSTDSRTSWKDL